MNGSKKTLRILALLLTLAVLLSGTLAPLTFADSPGANEDKSLTILFTHDLHDHFYPEAVISENTTSLGGYAKLYTAIQEEREKDPELILVDAGDFSMGSLFQTIFASASPQLRIMGKMGYDATTLGNHEFDFRPEGLADSLKAALASQETLPAIVASNMIFHKDKDGTIIPELRDLKRAMDEYGVKDYEVFIKNGLKIGVFGLMGKDADSNAPMSVVGFEDIVTRSKEIVARLKNDEKVDLILCLSHSGTDPKKSKSEDEILAKKVPEIDVIVSGHTHTELPEAIIVGNTVIGSAGNYGENLGIIKLKQVASDDQSRWTLDSYRLKPIDDSIESDSEIEEIIEEYKEVVNEEYLAAFGLDFDQTVAYAPFDLTDFSQLGRELQEETIGNLIGDAYFYAIEQAEGKNYDPVAVALSPNGTIRGSFVEGKISTSDIFNVSSLGIGPDKIPGYPLLTVYLTGKEIKTMAEVDASVSPLMPAAQLYVAGLRYTLNPYRLIFNKVTDVKLVNRDGEETEIVDDELYRVAAGLYSAQMLSVVGSKSFGILKIIPKDKDGVPIEDFEKHIVYDQNGEVKEWIALAQYLASFRQKKGVPQIPNYYSQTHDYKIVDKDKHPVSLLKNPNKIGLAIYSLVILILILVVGGVYLRRRRKREKYMFRKS